MIFIVSEITLKVDQGRWRWHNLIGHWALVSSSTRSECKRWHGSVVNDLGVLRDSQLITLSDLTLSRSRFFYTRQVRLIKRSLTPEATKTLVHALVSSRLDYCNSVLTGLSGHLLRKLQVIQNAAARLIIPEPEDPNIWRRSCAISTGYQFDSG